MGIGLTGLVTYAYFSLASYSLNDADYGRITLLWSAIFFTVSVLYRPVEQLLARTIADREARREPGREHLRVAATIQLGFALLFAAAALIMREELEDDLLGGSSALYWVLIATVITYALSYFTRGWLAGRRRFALYGGLQLMESATRCMFALAVAVGLASGQAAVALGMAAAPLISLAVVPLAVRRKLRPGPARSREEAGAGPTADKGGDPGAAGAVATGGGAGEPQFTLSEGSGFAAAVVLIMLSEQTFLNAGPLVVKATAEAGGAALAGFVFNALLIARAPLQLFQAVQTSILPHLTRLRAGGHADPFRRSVNVTLAAIGAFAAAVALAMLAFGPALMDVVFGTEFDYAREGLALVGVGMGLYLAAATLNQAALARARGKQAAACWVLGAAAFLALLLVPGVEDRVLQVQWAFAGAALLLCALLWLVYRRSSETP